MAGYAEELGIRYRGLPADGVRLRDLPPVTKPQLMDRFADWVADPALSGAATRHPAGPC